MLRNNLKYKSLIYAFILLFFIGCNKDDNNTNVNEIIYGLKTDSTSVLADGTSLVHITCELDSNATSDRFGVLFKINSGTFVGGNDTIIISQAQFIGTSLIAKAVITVPQTPGPLIISAQPNIPNIQGNNFIQKDTIQLLPSVPDSISLVPNNSGINSNYGSEVTLTGTLFNSLGSKVSLGYKVQFGDSLAGAIPALGNWRAVVDTVNNNSQVSAVYGAGSYSIGTPIYITCTLLDPLGRSTGIVGATRIFINK